MQGDYNIKCVNSKTKKDKSSQKQLHKQKKFNTPK